MTLLTHSFYLQNVWAVNALSFTRSSLSAVYMCVVSVVQMAT